MENCIVFYRSLKESIEDWQEYNCSYVKGFAFKGAEFLTGYDLLSEMLDAIRCNALANCLSILNGHFAAIILHGSDIILVSDKIRSFPILYTVKDKVYCADSGESVRQMLQGRSISPEFSAEFSIFGYLSGGDTLIKGIRYVPAGEFVVCHHGGRVENISYHTFSCDKKMVKKTFLLQTSRNVLQESFRRTIQSIGQYSRILIPLSGGYDSRLIACLCKEMNLQNVLCYTYGKLDSFEVIVSKRVAETLGFQWKFVEYNEDVWNSTLSSDEFKQYFIFSGCLSGTPHFQDFPALMQLKREQLIDSNTVVIPGHSGDLLGGSKIPVENVERRAWRGQCEYFSDDIVGRIYSHFAELNILREDFVFEEKSRLKKTLSLRDDCSYTNDEFLDKYECEFFIKSRIGNFIVNSCRAYEFFGMRWRAPLWDTDYASLWYSIPWEMKYNSVLYNRFMFMCYFDRYHVDFNKSHNTLKHIIKKVLKVVLPTSIKSAYRSRMAGKIRSTNKSNFNAFEYVINYMEKQIDQSDFYFISQYNHGNINASTSLYYIQIIKGLLQLQ